MADDRYVTDTLAFLSNGGEMGAAIRAKDWTGTPLGPPESWPPELRTVIRLMLTTNHPIFVFWGPDLSCFYNDAYSQSIGPERHPGALGRPGREVWDEIWDIIGPQIELVMSGKGATWNEDHLVPITRHGRRDQVYWTYSYSPIDDPAAARGVGGVLVICTETTKRVEAEQALALELDAKEQLLREVNHRIKNSLQLVSSLLRIEGSRAETPEIRASLGRAAARVQAISAVHELIYRTDNIATVEFGPFLKELCRGAAGAGPVRRPDIAIACSSVDIEISTDLAIALSIITNELVTNALTHAYPEGRTGTIEVRLDRRDGGLELSVRDDGVGKAARDKTGGRPRALGLRIVSGVVRQIGGTLEETGGDTGCEVRVSVPLSGDRP